MRCEESHVSDRDLLMYVDDEVSTRRKAKINRHLSACWKCRARLKELENTITDFVTVCQRHLDLKLPASTGPRAMMKAQLARIAGETRDPSWLQSLPFPFNKGLGYLSAIVALLVLGLAVYQIGRLPRGLESRTVAAGPFFSPDPAITPGVAHGVTPWQVCSQEPDEAGLIPASMGREVFKKYGIVSPPPRAYELDYLISPELGGAADVRNLWPQPYSGSVWNAHVKDALEDYLRHLVCTQQISLTKAQYDISTDWIAAYKKYFHQDAPSPDHLAFLKDRPWE